MSQSRFARSLFIVNAVVAWSSVGVSFYLMLIGFYANKPDLSKPTLLGNVVGGNDQIWERFFDWISYFTILSNIVVAVVMTMLVIRPEVFTGRIGNVRRWQALRLDSVVMILVTGVVYNLLLRGDAKTGIDLVSDTLQHVINPIVTVLVWLLVGPRGILKLRTIWHSLALPLAWAVVALARGEVIGAYPYFFLDVATNGLLAVVEFIVGILVATVVIEFLLLGYDKLLSRR